MDTTEESMQECIGHNLQQLLLSFSFLLRTLRSSGRGLGVFYCATAKAAVNRTSAKGVENGTHRLTRHNGYPIKTIALRLKNTLL